MLARCMFVGYVRYANYVHGVSRNVRHNRSKHSDVLGLRNSQSLETFRIIRLSWPTENKRLGIEDPISAYLRILTRNVRLPIVIQNPQRSF